MTQREYDQKKRECWEEYKRESLDGEVQWQPVSRYDVFCAAFDRAYSLGKQEKDAEDNRTLKANRQLFCRLCADADVPKNAESGTHSFSHILKDDFRDHNRLHIAAILAAGMLASEVRCYPVDRALELADKLIAECEKGDNHA